MQRCCCVLLTYRLNKLGGVALFLLQVREHLSHFRFQLVSHRLPAAL